MDMQLYTLIRKKAEATETAKYWNGLRIEIYNHDQVLVEREEGVIYLIVSDTTVEEWLDNSNITPPILADENENAIVTENGDEILI